VTALKNSDFPGLEVKISVLAYSEFLDSKEDIRSSYYLEDVATKFNCKV
jgi:hypothetical protein